jgi:DNA-binding transcriptional MocR family regulator
VAVRYHIAGSTAKEIAASIEGAVLSGELKTGEHLPPVRDLAARLRLSNATVASAYNLLRMRGLVIAEGRRGTLVSHQPPLSSRVHQPFDGRARNLAQGNPDPALLPPLAQALKRLRARPRMYGERQNLPDLLKLAARMFRADSIAAGPIAVVSGAMDGTERVLQTATRAGDRVAVEDPGYHMVIDLARALGLVVMPVGVDDSGLLPEDTARALRSGAAALIVTPRAQNPTGAALDRERAAELRRLLRAHPGVLIVEDDHAGPVAGARALSLVEPGRARWAVVRSVSKWLGPDLRVALVTGDELTIGRLEGRQRLGTGWVSHVLQELTVEIISDPATERLVRKAADVYSARRAALVGALAAHSIPAHGRSGLNVWIPVPEEVAAVRWLAESGWTVAGGERFRIKSPPAIRVSIATLQPDEAVRFASDLASVFAPQPLAHSA